MGAKYLVVHRRNGIVDFKTAKKAVFIMEGSDAQGTYRYVVTHEPQWVDGYAYTFYTDAADQGDHLYIGNLGGREFTHDEIIQEMTKIHVYGGIYDKVDFNISQDEIGVDEELKKYGVFK
jgi:hypothetical protein